MKTAPATVMHARPAVMSPSVTRGAPAHDRPLCRLLRTICGLTQKKASTRITGQGPLTCDDASRGGRIRTHDLFVPNDRDLVIWNPVATDERRRLSVEKIP